jgi:hypothetical protein
MRYLRKYNEELKSDTYKSAADKLARMGHVKRPEELMKWHVVAKDREKEEAKRKAIEESSKLGVHKITLTHRGDKFTGDFYVYFYWENDNFDENYNDWRTFDNNSIWILLSFAVIPASEESKEYTINFLNKEIGVSSDDKCYLGQIGINLTQGGNTYDEESSTGGVKETFEFKPNGSYYQEDWHGIDWIMADRASAQKFKKMLYDVFSGEILWRESEKVPGGIKEQLIEELCNERGHDLSEYIDFVESIKKIRVNQLYKD